MKDSIFIVIGFLSFLVVCRALTIQHFQSKELSTHLIAR